MVPITDIKGKYNMSNPKANNIIIIGVDNVHNYILPFISKEKFNVDKNFLLNFIYIILFYPPFFLFLY